MNGGAWESNVPDGVRDEHGDEAGIPENYQRGYRWLKK
jgi:hypothetical protein